MNHCYLIVEEPSERQDKCCKRQRGHHHHDRHPELLEERGEHGEQPGDVQRYQDQHYAVPCLPQSSEKGLIDIDISLDCLLPCPAEDLC